MCFNVSVCLCVSLLSFPVERSNGSKMVIASSGGWQRSSLRSVAEWRSVLSVVSFELSWIQWTPMPWNRILWDFFYCVLTTNVCHFSLYVSNLTVQQQRSTSCKFLLILSLQFNRVLWKSTDLRSECVDHANAVANIFHFDDFSIDITFDGSNFSPAFVIPWITTTTTTTIRKKRAPKVISILSHDKWFITTIEKTQRIEYIIQVFCIKVLKLNETTIKKTKAKNKRITRLFYTTLFHKINFRIN